LFDVQRRRHALTPTVPVSPAHPGFTRVSRHTSLDAAVEEDPPVGFSVRDGSRRAPLRARRRRADAAQRLAAMNSGGFEDYAWLLTDPGRWSAPHRSRRPLRPELPRLIGLVGRR
jgi:hypothetical protein